MTDIDLATEALREVLDEGSFGELISTEDIPKGIELKFKCLMPGYTDWHWQVTLSKVTVKSAPTVSEINLLAGDDSLVSPPWVPWAERLAEYRKARKEQREALLRAEDSEPSDDAWIDVDENKMDEPVEIDLPNLELPEPDVEKSKDAEADTDQGGVKPPAKATRAKRVKKTEDDKKDNNPDHGAE